jgi:hypothetical protein
LNIITRQRLLNLTFKLLPGALEPIPQNLLAGGNEKGVLYGDAAQLADLGK